jgi:hypothetical protein
MVKCSTTYDEMSKSDKKFFNWKLPTNQPRQRFPTAGGCNGNPNIINGRGIMHTSKLIRTGLTFTLVFQILISTLVPGGVVAAAEVGAANELPPPVSDLPWAAESLAAPNFTQSSSVFLAGNLSNPQAPTDTTLEVQILSSPWATLDSNPKPGEDLPGVFVVEAAVTNTGLEAATGVTVTLDSTIGFWWRGKIRIVGFRSWVSARPITLIGLRAILR